MCLFVAMGIIPVQRNVSLCVNRMPCRVCLGFPLKRTQAVMVAQLSYLNDIIGIFVNDSMFII